MNVQFAVKDAAVYVLEVNPRASRTVPFVSKATGVPLAKVAARVMAGEKLADMGLRSDEREPNRFCVKEAVMPFGRFPGADSILGPEMKSTGEVMGVADDFPAAYAKSQLAIDYSLPTSGCAFVSVCDRDKRHAVSVAKHLQLLGFSIMSTRGTAKALRAAGIPVTEVLKKHEGRPNVIDEIANGKVQLVINTPFGQETRSDGYHIRSAAIRHGITNITTLPAASAIVQAIEAVKEGRLGVCALQDFDSDDAARCLVTRRDATPTGARARARARERAGGGRRRPGHACRLPAARELVAPGQFVHLRVSRGSDRLLRRPFSIHRAYDGRVEILYQVLGRGHAASLPRSPQATRRWTSWARSGMAGRSRPVIAHALLVAGGLGAAPLGMLAERLAELGVAAVVAQGAPTAERLVARDLFERVARRVEVATDDGSAGTQGLRDRPHRTPACRASASTWSTRCGPEVMQRAIVAQARAGRSGVSGLARASHGVRHRRVPLVRGHHDLRSEARLRGRPGLRRGGGAVEMDPKSRPGTERRTEQCRLGDLELPTP